MATSMAALVETQKLTEETLRGANTALEEKVRQLSKELAHSEKTLQNKELDVAEVERELEAKKEKISELTAKQMERLEQLQKMHQREITALRDSHQKEIADLQREQNH